MDKINERCAICGEPIEADDEKVFCPDCGAPMHGDCYRMEGKCPNMANHTAPSDKPESHHGSSLPPDFQMSGTGTHCEICGRPFSDNDEKVHCPECGAAMHRVCYNMTHSCPYADRHGKQEDKSDPAPSQDADGRPLCGICGKPLSDSDEMVYCPDCGTPVHKECWAVSPECPNKHRHGSGFDWNKEQERLKAKAAKNFEPADLADEQYSDIRSISFDKFSDTIIAHPIRSKESGEELTCCGVKQTELVHFLGMNNLSTPRFFSLFMSMANSGKVFSLNLSAWFFAPLYHFYRRMTGPAVLLSIATFILMIPTMILEIMYWGKPDTMVMNVPLSNAATITSYIMVLVRVAILIFNDYIYMRWSVSKILSLRERYKDADDEEYYAALEHRGNPRMMYVLGGISLLMFLVYVLNIFISAMGIAA